MAPGGEPPSAKPAVRNGDAGPGRAEGINRRLFLYALCQYLSDIDPQYAQAAGWIKDQERGQAGGYDLCPICFFDSRSRARLGTRDKKICGSVWRQSGCMVDADRS